MQHGAPVIPEKGYAWTVQGLFYPILNKNKIVKYFLRLPLVLFACILMPALAYATRGKDDIGLKIFIGFYIILIIGIIVGIKKLISYIKKKFRKL